MRSSVKRGAQCARQAAALVAALTLLGSSACGSDGGDPEQGPSISPMLDTDREASASIGPDGGSVAATAADGTEYTLAIPAEALIEDTEISLTPILGIDDLPMSGGLVAGVHFEPSGLELFRTATLSVTLPEAPTLGSEELLAGFTYDGDGENLALALADAAGDSFTLPENDYRLFAELQDRALGMRLRISKGELLRAGLHALDQMSDQDFLAVLQTVEKLKPGRSKASAG